MPTLASFSRPGSWKASSLMNSDIVNPIPASAARPTRCRHRSSLGSLAPSRTDNQENPEMPSIFPATRPAVIPRVIGELADRLRSWNDNGTPAFARAKTGRIR
jgi:hypothetical protein